MSNARIRRKKAKKFNKMPMIIGIDWGNGSDICIQATFDGTGKVFDVKDLTMDIERCKDKAGNTVPHGELCIHTTADFGCNRCGFKCCRCG